MFTCDSEGNVVCIGNNHDPATNCTGCLPGRDLNSNCVSERCLPGRDLNSSHLSLTEGNPSENCGSQQMCESLILLSSCYWL